MVGRIPRLTIGFRRTLAALNIVRGSRRSLAVHATVQTLTTGPTLPGRDDARTRFAPGVAWMRRVPRENLWILYRFDEVHLDVIALRDEPPVPVDDDDA